MRNYTAVVSAPGKRMTPIDIPGFVEFTTFDNSPSRIIVKLGNDAVLLNS